MRAEQSRLFTPKTMFRSARYCGVKREIAAPFSEVRESYFLRRYLVWEIADSEGLSAKTKISSRLASSKRSAEDDREVHRRLSAPLRTNFAPR